MKKLFFFLFAASAVVFSACNNDDDSSSSGNGGGGGGSSSDTAFYIKWTQGGVNYNLSDASSDYSSSVGSDSSIGDPVSCYGYQAFLSHVDGTGISASVGIDRSCFLNEEWNTDAFFSIFQEMSYDYSATGNDFGAMFSIYNPADGSYAVSYTAQPGSSNFTITDVQNVTPSFGYPYVIIKGTFNCKLDDGSTITNGSFRVICEKS